MVQWYYTFLSVALNEHNHLVAVIKTGYVKQTLYTIIWTKSIQMFFLFPNGRGQLIIIS